MSVLNVLSAAKLLVPLCGKAAICLDLVLKIDNKVHYGDLESS
jgi:hypothetical protein